MNRVAALMAYLQLSLWNIPGEIIVGNSLSMELQECWLTPAHNLNNWKYRLTLHALFNDTKTKKLSQKKAVEENQNAAPENKKVINFDRETGAQVAFDFEL